MNVVARETWTDERLDDLAKHMDENFQEVRADLREHRERMDKMLVKQERMDAKFDVVMRTMQIGFGFIAVLLAALLGLIGTQL
jgi:hypothetical protein